ncbi:hypothetical protein [Candidatus Coxiella mudrowiae]|uniref:hypothetical protein n=1 Tax=Candidatus Coxiella mudrowiae TaxID=2054173 RepID=UPI001FD5302C|nr:hypothetical protein [Candidatus Coxiella mudrowiae]
MKTLIIVDAQNNFMAGGSLEVPNAEAIILVIDKLQPQFDLVNSNPKFEILKIIKVLLLTHTHPGKKPFDKIVLHGL